MLLLVSTTILLTYFSRVCFTTNVVITQKTEKEKISTKLAERKKNSDEEKNDV
jgi:hypothetical protein